MAEHDITLTVNGAMERLTVESRTLLVHALRDELGYTGPNVGCESGKCGACTVALDGDAVKSCTLLAVQADGCEVTTAGGLADVAAAGSESGVEDTLHPIQAAFHEEHGLQCGYCTPGMLMTTEQFLAENPDPSREEIRTALKGNVCRCTGYGNVVDAVETAAETLADGSVSESAGESAAESAERPADESTEESTGAVASETTDERSDSREVVPGEAED